ncbi:lipase family protein [Fuerstiella marisgermanici]|nr:lipase family protein [Fuerstiella marisgermanici]
MSDAASLVPIHSKITCPIEEKPMLVQSLLFAELSSASYYDEVHAERIVEHMGFEGFQYYDRDGAQAYMYWNDTDCVVACRGTEPNEWNDIKADANAVAVVTETFGRVHKGFNQEVDDLWPILENALVENKKTLWFTGHSLGGAMATICAGRCYLSEIESMPKALFTYGSPRVGDKQFVNFVELDHTRWVNNNDIVTRVPPAWMGYRHGGTEKYLNCNGKFRDLSGVLRRADRWRGFLRGLLSFKVDHFSDHSIDRYVEYILGAVQEAGDLQEVDDTLGKLPEGESPASDGEAVTAKQ